MSEESTSKKSPMIQRLNYAWEPLKRSLMFRVFGAVSFFALADNVLKMHKSLVDMGWISNGVVEAAEAIYVFLFMVTIRSIFLVAEEAGRHIEEIQTLSKANEAHCEVYTCLHSIIHETRDCLLTESSYRKLLAMTDEDHIRHLYDTIQRQLGMMEKALRTLSDSDCSIVLKIIKRDAVSGEEKLVSACYGPSTPIDRRSSSTVLPLNQGIAYQAIVTKSICHSNDIAKDQTFWPQDQKVIFAENRYRTIVVCPIIVNKVVSGLLCFDWKQPEMYCKEYEQMLACFTDIVSVACYICHESKNVTPKPK